MKLSCLSVLAVAALMGCRGTNPAPVQPQPERLPTEARSNGLDEPYRHDYDRASRGFEPRQQGSNGSSGGRRRSNRSRPENNAAPGQFDFYLLNLSWSPEFCATHPQSDECAARPGFIVHGLWPQNGDGSYPENCGESNFPNPGLLTDVMPTASLIQHEWRTHGTCTGLAPGDFAAAVHRAYAEVHIPPAIANVPSETMLTPDAILSQFAAANPGFPQGSITLSCGNNRLTAVEVCLSKDLRPEACQGVRSCHANQVKITPR